MARGRPKGSTKGTKPKTSKKSTSPRKQKRAKKDPNAPKRGRSAYMIWLAENRPRLTKPGMSVVDVTKAAGAEWNKLKDKSKYEKIAAQEKQRYELEMKKYKGTAGGSPSKSPKKK